MASYNKIIFGGNVVSDPVSKPMGNSTLATFSVASNRKRKDAEGNVKEEVCFLEVEAWGKQADICVKYLHRGEPVMIEGRLKQSTWDDKNGGGKRSKHSLICEDIILLAPPKDASVKDTSIKKEPKPEDRIKAKIDMIRDAGFQVTRIDSTPIKPKLEVDDLPF